MENSWADGRSREKHDGWKVEVGRVSRNVREREREMARDAGITVMWLV